MQTTRRRLASSIGWYSGKLQQTTTPLEVLNLFRLLRRAPQYKKHKTWDGDGVLVLSGGKGFLHGMDSKMYVEAVLELLSLADSEKELHQGSPIQTVQRSERLFN